MRHRAAELNDLVPKFFVVVGTMVSGIRHRESPVYQCTVCGDLLPDAPTGARAVGMMRQHFSENAECRQLRSSMQRFWSRLIRSREGHICYVCSEKFPWRQTQAHHIFPKAIYPERAYWMDSGVCVCGPCHQPRIHSTWESWEKFVPMLDRYIDSAEIQRFNLEPQIRLDERAA